MLVLLYIFYCLQLKFCYHCINGFINNTSIIIMYIIWSSTNEQNIVCMSTPDEVWSTAMKQSSWGLLYQDLMCESSLVSNFLLFIPGTMQTQSQSTGRASSVNKQFFSRLFALLLFCLLYFITEASKEPEIPWNKSKHRQQIPKLS